MTRINFEIPDTLAIKFKSLVGDRNQSVTLRGFIEEICFNNSDEKALEAKLNKLKTDISQLEINKNSIQFQLNRIKEQREKKEQEQRQLEEQKLNFDPFAHIQGTNKLNSVQRLLYRVERTKFLPVWATKRNPDNPKEYALKLLQRLEKQLKGDKI